jgi:glycosyltransferase involved in cell wall biosynthesis
MKIAALLPHVEVFGGIRRYIEIGNEITRREHKFVLFSPLGGRPGWLEFKGIVKPFSSLEEESFDIGLCSEYSILPCFEKLKARAKFFYFLLEGHKKENEVARGRYSFLGNSEGLCRRLERKYGIKCHRAPGGVNPEIFYPLKNEAPRDTFNILCYGRIYRKRKGIQHVIRAAERLHKKYSQIKLIFFDSLVGEDRRDPRPMIKTRIPYDFHLDLPQGRMAWLYSQADVFVSAERRAGWSNTSAEAMACRIPVVCTRSGTRDFAVPNQTALVVPFPLPILLSRQIEKLILHPSLRERLAQAGYERIQQFTWPALVDRLETIFREEIRGEIA